jgi:uncharacterized protein (DUF736 family)
MSYEQKDLTGSLFKNKRKEKDTHPEYTGTVTVNGEQYWLSAWLKKDKHSETYMSLSLKPKDEPPRKGARLSAQTPKDEPDDFADRDIPF